MTLWRYIIIVVLAVLIHSCSLSDRIEGKDVVARIGDNVLYKSEIDAIMPKGISKEDSTVLVEQYINSWAIKRLMLIKAESELSKEDLDVEKQLEEYKMQLLAYRYESMFISQKIDTLVVDNQISEYYNEHKEKFVTQDGVMKGRVIKIINSSPNLKSIAQNLLQTSRNQDDYDDMEEVISSSAYAYSNYNNSWVDISDVSKDVGVEYDLLLASLKNKKFFQQKDSLYTTMVQCLEFIAPGQIAPYDYCKKKIADIIISKRKQDIEKQLKKDILDEALSYNKLKIIKKDENK